MDLNVKNLVTRQGAFVSAMTALLVGAALIVQRLFEILITALHVFGQQYGVTLWQILLPALPFAFGFFVSLWIIAPIAEELRLPHVITRAVIATGIASTVVFLVAAVVGLATAVSFDGYLFGQSFPAIRFEGSWALNAIVNALTSAALTFVSTLPLGVLAGVLLWLWRKDRLSRRPLAGPTAEV